MAGVAGPMLRQRRWHGVRFLVALAAGGVAAGLVLAVPVYLVGSVLHDALPRTGRVALLAAVVVALAVADLRDRTPHVFRQVPQRLVRVLPPGVLGLVWGFDLGLLFTTQKVVSLIWAATAAAILLAPAAAPVLLAVVAFAATAAVSAWSMTRYGASVEKRMDRTWIRRARRGSAVAMLLLAIVSAIAA
jgi:Na+/citrate or Na+/malate symporter